MIILPDGNQLVSIPQRYPLNQILLEIYTCRSYEREQKLLPGMVVVDVGASIGIFTIHAATEVGPTGKVIAIEPDPTSFNSLIENLQANNITNVIAIQKAAWNINGALSLYMSPVWVGNTLMPDLSTSPNVVTVETTRIDDILPALGITEIDFVKMDIEGAELEALEGLQQHMNQIKNFAISGYHTKDAKYILTNYLQQAGFSTAIHPYFFVWPMVYASNEKELFDSPPLTPAIASIAIGVGLAIISKN